MSDPPCSRQETCQGTDLALQVILRTTPVPLAITRVSDGTILFANEQVRTTFGLPSDGRIDIKSAELYCDPEDGKRLLAALEWDGYVANCEVQVYKTDRTPRWVALSAAYLTYGGETAVFTAFHDITERKERSKELEERTAALEQANADLAQTVKQLKAIRDLFEGVNERFASIIGFIPVPIAIARRSTNEVMYANDHFAVMYGLARGSEIVGRNMKDFFLHPDDRSALLHSLDDQRYLSNRELLYKKVDKSELWVAAYFCHLEYEGEDAVFGAYLDITERKQYSARLQGEVEKRTIELEAARDGALAANQAKNEFLANVSHELRNPLNQINGYCALLEEAAVENGHDYLLPDLREARASTNSLCKLVDDILDLTRMGAVKVRLLPEEFPVDEFVQKLAGSLAEEVQRNDNRLEVSCAAEVGSMYTDRDRLRQILTNLLSNACKFTEHGIVRLHVGRQTRRSKDWLVFTVADTGIGMTAEEVKRLFTPFQQASPDIGRKYGGTGLGLAISQGYCQAMGGSISVTSEPGKGSQFSVQLPAVINAQVVRPPLAPATEPASPLSSGPVDAPTSARKPRQAPATRRRGKQPAKAPAKKGATPKVRKKSKKTKG